MAFQIPDALTLKLDTGEFISNYKNELSRQDRQVQS